MFRKLKLVGKLPEMSILVKFLCKVSAIFEFGFKIVLEPHL